jgi:hypothetical protein
MTGYWKKEWYGPELQARGHRAAARALIGFATRVAVETKMVTHVMSGTLRRSVHAAPAHYEGAYEDERRAEGGEDLLDTSMAMTATPTHAGYAVEVGSWMPYACVEWVGRGHPGVTQGLEAARPMVGAIFQKAFREEGL